MTARDVRKGQEDEAAVGRAHEVGYGHEADHDHEGGHRIGHDHRAGWTLDELTLRVTQELPGWASPSNGRVRAVPDGRTIRWYTTVGLVDRPSLRGRSVRYGPRHLWQILAIKVRQAQGRSLTEIQAELTGAPDATLCQIIDLPSPRSRAALAAASAGRATRSADADRSTDSDTDADIDAGTDGDDDVLRHAQPQQFWAARPAGQTPSVSPPSAQSVPSPPVASGPGDGVFPAGLLARFHISLAPGADLVLSRPPTADDITAIQAAAVPLVGELRARALLQPDHTQLDRAQLDHTATVYPAMAERGDPDDQR